MRTTLLLLGTMLLLAGGFALYWAFQPPGAVKLPVAATQVSPKPIPGRRNDSNYTVGGGKGAWLKQFDQQNRLTHQFRAHEYDPQKEGFVRVAKPEVHFFLKGGQWIKVTGRTGDVYVAGLPETGAGGDLFASGGASGPQMPSRGRLQDVRIYFYETPDAAEPMLDLDVNNAAFDNESFRIYTEGYTDADGKHVAADQVKVTVRGKYEFDGRGLTIRWNDRDQRLELMEVAHGEQLVVKDPDSMGKEMPGSSKPREAVATEAPRVEAPDAAPPEAPVPGTEQVVVVAPNPATAPTKIAKAPEAESTPYSIWFHDNVRVEQEGKTLARADVIEVYHAMRDTQAKQPATAPAPAAGDSHEAAAEAPSPATPDGAAPPAPAPAPSPTTKPTTQPTTPQGPIIVKWTGKLRIVPTVAGPPVELLPGQTAVQMRGSPVVITRDAAEIRCPALTYRTADGGITLHNSKDFPFVTIAQFATAARAGKPDLTLFSEWVEYAAEEGVATLGGKSRAEFPADQSGEAGGGDTATAVWTREGIVRFAEADGETYVQDLQLGGDVDVQHPQVAIRSQQLTLAFAPPMPQGPSKNAGAEEGAGATPGPAASSQQVVRKVTARESVHCVLRDGAEQPRELYCEQLDLATATDPAGKLYPKIVNARGNVRATEAGQALTAQELDLILAPADPTKAAVAGAKARRADGDGGGLDTASLELVRMVARSDVKANLDDGSEVTATSLVVTNANGKPTIGLSGKPARLVDGQGNVVTSTRIVIPRSNEAQALGPGSLRAAMPGKEGEAPQFMDVTWTKHALLNGNLKENQVDVTGDVRATLPDADGSVNTARSGRILLTLAPKPVDPAAAAATRPKSPRQDGDKAKDAKGKDAGPLASMKFDALDGQEVSQIVLSGDAVVDSRLADADGSVLREMRVESSLLYYNVKAERFVVPRPGRMLVRDHRAPGKPTDPAAASALGSQPGATAFQWAKQLDYDGLARRATIEENVSVAFRPDKEGDSPVQLRADRFVATFHDPAAPKVKDATKGGSTGALGKMPTADLKSVTAEGNVNVIRGDAELTAPRLTFDPGTKTIVASESPTARAVFSHTGRRDSLSARSFIWNTTTWDIKVVDAAANVSAGR